MSAPTQDPVDERLARSVKDAISRSEPIRALDMGSLQVEVRGGIVHLRGLVASEAHSFQAAQRARKVPGVKDVVNELSTDEELERRIGIILATHGKTRGHRIAVNVVGGIAGLYGVVPAEEDAEALRCAALAVPGVAGVESRLQVVPPGTPVVLAWQQSLEGRPRT